MKAKLREHRSAALEARQRGQESFETLRMASEELRALPEERRFKDSSKKMKKGLKTIYLTYTL